MIRPGRPVRLELNAQRVTDAMHFYRKFFGWTSIPLHVPPWGSIPQIANGDRVFANEFMAMGAFAQPKWMIWFSADLEKAEAAVKNGGGDLGQGIYPIGDLGHMLDASDPSGNRIAAISLNQKPPEVDAPGDPCLAELWGNDASKHAEFYGEFLGLKVVPTELGAKLTDGDVPRIFIRNAPYELAVPIWIPYFLSKGVGGDCERARRAGAIVQVHKEVVEDVGELAVLSDTSGAYFGLVNPSKTH